MIPMTTSTKTTPAIRPAPVASTQAIGTAHRLDDGRVLTTAEEHAAVAMVSSTPSPRSSSEALTDG